MCTFVAEQFFFGKPHVVCCSKKIKTVLYMQKNTSCFLEKISSFVDMHFIYLWKACCSAKKRKKTKKSSVADLQIIYKTASSPSLLKRKLHSFIVRNQLLVADFAIVKLCPANCYIELDKDLLVGHYFVRLSVLSVFTSNTMMQCLA